MILLRTSKLRIWAFVKSSRFFWNTDRTHSIGTSLTMLGAKKITLRLSHPPIASSMRSSPIRFPGSDLIQDQSRSRSRPRRRRDDSRARTAVSVRAVVVPLDREPWEAICGLPGKPICRHGPDTCLSTRLVILPCDLLSVYHIMSSNT